MNDTARPSFIPARWKDRTGAFYDFRACWTYRDAAGESLGVVARFDSAHHGKQVIPFGSMWIPDSSPGYATSNSKRGPSRPLPRTRALCTN